MKTIPSLIVFLMIIFFTFMLKPTSKSNITNYTFIKPLNSYQIAQYARDSNRYIAHAGGQIDGFNYTNSLEALNLSYRKGFKKFELDIILTSDGHFVAAHDWQKWQRISSFKDQIPPTRDEFLNQKIYGKYTAMDMTAINKWFKNHPDTLLITDKINQVESFANQFVDKNRLMMELFSWDSVSEAESVGIRSALPTGGLLKDYPDNLIEKLKHHQIEEVALSRKFIESEIELLNTLKTAGIKMYAFHVNSKQGTGTGYMICNESHYFYGIYADNWQKDWQPNCH
ncbi:MAG: hypothetical protein ACK5L8_03515 [Marinicella pacifica]